MKNISLIQPGELTFGNGAFESFLKAVPLRDYQRIWVLSIEPLRGKIDSLRDAVLFANKQIEIHTFMEGEPTFGHFRRFFPAIEAFQPDLVVGIGGGSVLDLAKILAVMVGNDQVLEDVIGINQLNGRRVGLWCLPSTSGTGSEVSPNAILLDQDTLEKKGVISPFLVPDATFVDPSLTVSLPSKLTAETGIDALSHCMEAYTNLHSHPLIDDFALRGISHIGQHLLAAINDGNNLEARAGLSLGSLYGGLCLGPVNTAGVHALSYPLGGKYQVPHGLANAVLLPEVMAFNLPTAYERYAEIAKALGVKDQGSIEKTARGGVEKIREMMRECGIPDNLRDLGVEKDDIPELAELAMKVERLLKNNPRKIEYNDALDIYTRLM